MSYENMSLSGFGVATPGEVENIAKALSFDSQNYGDTLPGSFTGAPALQVESLDKTLRLVTFKERDLLMWRDIAKTPAFNTVEQYNVTNSYGTEVPAFFQMSLAPNVADSGYDRAIAQVKYLGIQKQVNHDVMLVKGAHGPIMQREIKNGAMWVLAQNERGLFFADDSVNSLEYPGLKKQVETNHLTAKFKATAFNGYDGYGSDEGVIVDNRSSSVAQVLDEETLEEAALIQSNNFGDPTDLYLDTKAHSDFSRAFFAKERIMSPLGQEGKAGYVVQQFVSGSGTFNLKSGKFLRPRRRTLAATPSVFAAPTIGNATAGNNSPADAASEFAAEDAGTYYYKVSAVYADGETLASTAFAVTVAAGDKVVVDITPASGTPSYYNVFRSAKDAADGSLAEFILRIPYSAGGINYNLDYNAALPGLSSAFLVEQTEDNIAYKQLLTMIKIDLALTGTQFKWMQNMYGTPVVYTPRKNVVIDNIGRN